MFEVITIKVQPSFGEEKQNGKIIFLIRRIFSLPATFIRSHQKKRILVQDVSGSGFQTAGILAYIEDLKRRSNPQIWPKDFSEMASSLSAFIRSPLPFYRAGESGTFNGITAGRAPILAFAE